MQKLKGEDFKILMKAGVLSMQKRGDIERLAKAADEITAGSSKVFKGDHHEFFDSLREFFNGFSGSVLSAIKDGISGIAESIRVVLAKGFETPAKTLTKKTIELKLKAFTTELEAALKAAEAILC
jgi:hypothetical protein